MNLPEIAEKAKQELAKVTGLPANTVVGIVKDEPAGWKVRLEMIERKSIPDSSDLLGIYEARMDESGQILSFKRKKLRRRMDIEAEEEE